MIITLVANLFLVFIQGVLNLFPTADSLGISTWANDISTTISGLPVLGWLNDYIPLSAMVTAITLVISIVFIMLTVNVILWIYHQIWGNN